MHTFHRNGILCKFPDMKMKNESGFVAIGEELCDVWCWKLMEGVRAEKLKLGRLGVTGCNIIAPTASRSFRDPAIPYLKVSSLFLAQANTPVSSPHNKMCITVSSDSVKAGKVLTI